MVDHKATQVCLLSQQAYPTERRATLTTAPPIGYLLRVEHETPDTVFRCIYSLANGRKIHAGPCQFESWTPAEPAQAPSANDEPVNDAS
jgi:hypothetical protein